MRLLIIVLIWGCFMAGVSCHYRRLEREKNRYSPVVSYLDCHYDPKDTSCTSGKFVLRGVGKRETHE